MSENETEQSDVPAQPFQGDQPQPDEQPDEQPADPGEKSDQDQGVGVAPTHAGDTEDGEDGTQFQTTAEVEGGGSAGDDAAEHI